MCIIRNNIGHAILYGNFDSNGIIKQITKYVISPNDDKFYTVLNFDEYGRVFSFYHYDKTKMESTGFIYSVDYGSNTFTVNTYKTDSNNGNSGLISSKTSTMPPKTITNYFGIKELTVGNLVNYYEDCFYYAKLILTYANDNKTAKQTTYQKSMNATVVIEMLHQTAIKTSKNHPINNPNLTSLENPLSSRYVIDSYKMPTILEKDDFAKLAEKYVTKSKDNSNYFHGGNVRGWKLTELHFGTGMYTGGDEIWYFYSNGMLRKPNSEPLKYTVSGNSITILNETYQFTIDNMGGVTTGSKLILDLGFPTRPKRIFVRIL